MLAATIGSWDEARAHLDRAAELPEHLRPFAEALLATPAGWRSWVRTHPACSAAEVQEVRRHFAPYTDRAVVIEAGDLPIYALRSSATNM